MLLRLAALCAGLETPDLVELRVGTLDDPGWFRLEADIFVKSGQPWDHMEPAIPNKNTYPPGRSYQALSALCPQTATWRRRDGPRSQPRPKSRPRAEGLLSYLALRPAVGSPSRTRTGSSAGAGGDSGSCRRPGSC